MKRLLQICLIFCFAANITGCVTGPVRYKTLGFRKFATLEMTKRAQPSAKPLAAPIGLISDIGITVLDTVATPIVSVPIAFELMGPCAQPTSTGNIIGKLIFSPIWFPISYPITSLGMPFLGTKFYDNWFGDEAETFKNELNPVPPLAARGSADVCATVQPWRGFLDNGHDVWTQYLDQKIDIAATNEPLAEVLHEPQFPNFNCIISFGAATLTQRAEPFSSEAIPERPRYAVTLCAREITRREALWRIAERLDLEMSVTKGDAGTLNAVFIRPKVRLGKEQPKGEQGNASH